MTGRLKFEHWVPVPLGEVFRFFSDPANLPRLMPPALDARLASREIVPPAVVGTEIAVSIRLFRFLPVRTLWIARIIEFERDHHFADVQAKGPFRRFAHRHEFEKSSRDGREGTIVRDVIEYDVGFGPLGAVAQRLFVGRQLRRTFQHRQRMLENLLSARE
jgi:ligand-binding SRPBCC domain-containing protein